MSLREGRASAPYNMALAGTAQKVNLRSRARRGLGFSEHGRRPVDTFRASISCDKLRLGAWVLGFGPDELQGRVFGCVNSRVGWGRRRGHVKPRVAKAWSEAPGVEGGVFFQLTDDGLSQSRRLVVEFNPAKMSDSQIWGLAASFRLMGLNLSRFWLERVDGAIDYRAPRRVLVLDDRQRLADHFGCGPNGPETERTGFRRGSRLKFQLYDKTAERQAKGADAPADITRFEVQWLKPTEVIHAAPLLGGPDEDEEEAWRLDRLAELPWPGGPVTVRCLPFHWATLEDPDWRGFLALSRGIGVRYAIRQYRLMGWAHRQVEQVIDCCLPVVSPAPDAVWAACWPAAASWVLGKLGEASEAVAAVGVPTSPPAAPVIDWGDDSGA